MTEKLLTDYFDENYSAVLENISTSAAKSGRTAEDITLLAAVKTVSPELINYAVSRGIRFIGDNKVCELKEKEPYVTRDVHKHFIGHLQTNKVKDVVPRVEMIESVGSLHLAEAINRQAEKENKIMSVLLEVNIGAEESKSGFLSQELFACLESVACLPFIRVEGLMAIPPVCERKEDSRRYFLQMQKLFVDIGMQNRDNINMNILSMGMSDTYTDAIECGATLVRLGTVLFGRRY